MMPGPLKDVRPAAFTCACLLPTGVLERMFDGEGFLAAVPGGLREPFANHDGACRSKR
jgi:hypothetical protein